MDLMKIDKKKILHIREEAETAAREIANEFGYGMHTFDYAAIERAGVDDIHKLIDEIVKKKETIYAENFDLSCICEMALLYLEQVEKEKKESKNNV